jgi:hypothetical protein
MPNRYVRKIYTGLLLYLLKLIKIYTQLFKIILKKIPQMVFELRKS